LARIRIAVHHDNGHRPTVPGLLRVRRRFDYPHRLFSQRWFGGWVQFGLGGNGARRVQAAANAIGVRFEGSYSQNSANDQLKAQLSAAVGSPTDAKVKILGGSVDLTYAFQSSSPAKAYLLAGIGMYNFKLAVSSGNATVDTSKTKFTWNGGAGLSYRLGGAALFLEARYFDMASPFGGSDIKYVPIIAGVRFGGR
jgi:opacity protein-like surface antigen